MIAAVSSSNFLFSIVNIISGLLVARWLLPKELGQFNALSIFTSYIILVQIGIPSGLSRELPYLWGRGKYKSARRLTATAKFLTLYSGILIVVLSFVVGIYYYYHDNYIFSAGSIVVGITSFQGLYITKYLKVLYRSNEHFNKLAKIKLILSAVTVVSLIFVYHFLFYGLCIRAVLLAVVDGYFTEKWKPLKVKASWSTKNFKELFRVGAPMYFVSNITGLWPTFQRTLILSMTGAVGLGLYAIATIVQNMLSTFNNSISSVTFPQMSMAYGKGAGIKYLLKMPLNYIYISLAAYLLIILIGWPLMPIVVDHLLPKYREGTEAAQWMLLVAPISTVTIFANIYLVLKKNHHRLISQILGISAWAIFIFVEDVESKDRLEVFSQALLVGYGTMGVADLYFYLFYIKNEKKLNS